MGFSLRVLPIFTGCMGFPTDASPLLQKKIMPANPYWQGIMAICKDLVFKKIWRNRFAGYLCNPLLQKAGCS